jgi:hypothetical protein
LGKKYDKRKNRKCEGKRRKAKNKIEMRNRSLNENKCKKGKNEAKKVCEE